MEHDLVAKRLLEINAELIIKEICGIDLKRAQILPLPQETILPPLPFFRDLEGAQLIDLQQELFASRMDDAPFFIKIEGVAKSEQFILLLDWQTVWGEEKVFDLMAFRGMLMKLYRLPVKTVMLLLQRHSPAQDYYEDEEMSFQFDLVKLYELKAAQFWSRMEKGQILDLAPFIPLMEGGLEMVEKALEALLGARKSKDSADLLTILLLFTGLVSKERAQAIRGRIMGITTESPVYEWIKAEGRAEGIEKGRAEAVRAPHSHGMATKAIAKNLDLPLEQVERYLSDSP